MVRLTQGTVKICPKLLIIIQTYRFTSNKSVAKFQPLSNKLEEKGKLENKEKTNMAQSN